MTFSLVARCSETGMFGVAVSSSSPAVAARCAHARAGVGAVASQNVTDPALGTRVLDMLEAGRSANEAVTSLKGREHIEYRQVLAVDRDGETAIHSGTNVLGKWGQAAAQDVASGGNLLANEVVPQAIVDGFLSARGHIGDRLLEAMRAGLEAGGEAGPVHSAGMLIVDELAWPLAELRCDWTDDCPIAAIEAAWAIYKPQMADYVQRALDPSGAPSYGVPGDQ
ncbi:DUF1028 domain-containing protein [Tepidamorphus sp. 3E244]|uniref:DUF1028 domain-containing protein n=1 Tax=Tepidamorphus sp. 3E244 TaxID=3385498 RepID=UPI0038FC5EF8